MNLQGLPRSEIKSISTICSFVPISTVKVSQVVYGSFSRAKP